MWYHSTRNREIVATASQAISRGIANDGGLFVPGRLPRYGIDIIYDMAEENYQQRAQRIFEFFLHDFSEEEIAHSVAAAYSAENFVYPEIAPVKAVSDHMYALELWHGPTHAFKDMALQVLPYLLTTAVKKTENTNEAVILVATSGDTGKAALEGFKDVEGTHVFVFYPDGGVSPIQYLQMATQQGDNVGVYAVTGNFDDTQTAVKEIFTNAEIIEELDTHGFQFSSANSINWGRLLPQIVYYFSAYADLVKSGAIQLAEEVNICVPTGNFGNILAAYYAKQMGLPVGKLVCASNKNNVLTDFFESGIYDRRREFYKTDSPSMDILISSNLERLLYALYEDTEAVAHLMEQLENQGHYQVSPEVQEKLLADFVGGYADDKETAETIKDVFENHGYLCDTHTAVAVNVYQEYVATSGDQRKVIVASTASPHKFAGSVLQALGEEVSDSEPLAQVQRLKELTGLEIPENMTELAVKPERFTEVLTQEEMAPRVEKALNIR